MLSTRPLTLWLCSLAMAVSATAAPLHVYRGQGMELRVTSEQADGSFAGELEIKGRTFPMSGRLNAGRDAAAGTFSSNGTPFDFSVQLTNQGDAAVFKTGRATYQLQYVDARQTAPPRNVPAGPATGNGSVVMKQHTLNDPGAGNIKSHTLLVPEGWNVNGGVQWNPASADFFVGMNLSITAPDGREFRKLPPVGFEYFEQQPQTQQTPQIGQTTMGGKVWMPVPRSMDQFVVQQLIPAYRPQARNVQVVGVGKLDALEQAMRQLLEPTLQQARQLDAQSKQTAAMNGDEASYRMDLAVPTVRVRYTENGRDYEEDFAMFYLASESYNTFRMVGSWMRASNWSVTEVTSFRAPAGQLDAARPVLQTVANSIRPTQRWYSIVAQMRKEISEMRLKLHRQQMAFNQKMFQERQKAITSYGDEILEMQRDSWKKQNDSSDRMNRAFSNAIRGVDDYTLPDGTTRSLDSSYDKVYVNGTGDFLFTNDLLTHPNEVSTASWQEIKPVTPMGGAANW